MATLLHGTIGVQHAAMAIYNAYVDRVPIVMIAGLDYDGPVAAHNADRHGRDRPRLHEMGRAAAHPRPTRSPRFSAPTPSP